MWMIQSEQLIGTNGLRFFVNQNNKPASFADVLAAWQNEAEFRMLYNETLAKAPFKAFRWETPALTLATMQAPCEFVLLDSPSLEGKPDPEAFAEHFKSTAGVVAFPNLGGDAILIVPRAQTEQSAYVHLGAFVRYAPADQQDVLWKLLGDTLKKRISTKPVWLSTAGAGVAWLHVRLDDRPKYYWYDPYRTKPQA